MKIELGETYKISNLHSKEFVENTTFIRDEIEIVKQTIWRWGWYEITPSSHEEAELLESASHEDWDGDVTPENDFEEFEYLEADDGYSEYSLESGDFDLEAAEDEYNDSEELQDEYFGFGEYLEEKLGFYCGDTESVISGPLNIEKVN